jgi:hypothetical protein
MPSQAPRLRAPRSPPSYHSSEVNRDKGVDREINEDGGKTHWTLAKLIRDPLIGLLMRSDGVDRHSIELLFERIARERPGFARQSGAAPSPKLGR